MQERVLCYSSHCLRTPLQHNNICRSFQTALCLSEQYKKLHEKAKSPSHLEEFCLYQYQLYQTSEDIRDVVCYGEMFGLLWRLCLWSGWVSHIFQTQLVPHPHAPQKSAAHSKEPIEERSPS